jgi:predicted DNA-binding protein YlxM (UPF0122 family)
MNQKLELLQKRITVSSPKTLNQIFANKKLYTEIMKRDVISEKELIDEYVIPLSYLKGLRSRGQISYFNTKGQLNISEQGTKYYYFLDEVKDLMSYKINYNESFVFRYNLMNKVVLDLAPALISEKEVELIRMFFKENMSMEEIAKKMEIGHMRVNHLLNKATLRIIYRTGELNKLHKHYQNSLELQTENEVLRNMNKSLYAKFKMGKQAANEDSIYGHFIRNGFDITDIKKDLQYELRTSLSVRTIGCLERADIKTIEELANYTRADLLRFRNFGSKSLDELCWWLEETYNWRLK